MKILITAGGTLIPIDPVRSIQNSSTGSFGATIARAALSQDMEVIYLAADASQTPFSFNFEYSNTTSLQDEICKLQHLYDFHQQYQKNYRQYRYHDFFEYESLLKNIVLNDKPDVVVLTAAVSDYLVSNYSETKVRSSEDWVIHLQTAPKLIANIKKWLPQTFLIGFKLLVDATDNELCEAALKSIHHNDADLIVANDLSLIKQGKHTILLVEKDGTYQKYTKNLGQVVIGRVLRR